MAWIQQRRSAGGEASYKVCWRDASGRQRSQTFRRRREAEGYKRHIEHELDAGTYRDPSLAKITFAELWDHYWRTSAPPAAATRELYQRHATKHLLPALGHVPIKAISRPMVRDLLSGLLERGVGARSVEQTLFLLRHVLNLAVDEGRLAANPAARLRAPLPKTLKREHRYLEPEEVQALAEEVPPRYRALVLFLAFSGPRIGEAAGLRMKNLDLDRGRVTILEQVAEVAGGLEVGPTKTGKSRSISLPAFLRDELKRHVDEWVEGPEDPDALVFPNEQGGFIRRTNFRSRVLVPAAKRAGITPTPTVHDLRHSACAIAVKAGLHPLQIKEMLGHSAIQVTLDTYGHLFESVHNEGAARIDALVMRGRSDSVVVPFREAAS